MKRVLVIDDHVVVRIGFVALVRQAVSPVEIAEADCLKAARPLVQRGDWDLIILDLDLPDGHGLDFVPEIRRACAKSAVLLVTGFFDVELVQRAIQTQAVNGFVEKHASHQHFKEAIAITLRGGNYLSPHVSEKLVFHELDAQGRAVHELLSEREFQVLRLLGSGKTVSEAANEMGVKLQTISTFRRRILEKLQLRSTGDLVRFALQKRLVK